MNEWIPISANSIFILCCHCQHESCFSPISLLSLGGEMAADTRLHGRTMIAAGGSNWAAERYITEKLLLPLCQSGAGGLLPGRSSQESRQAGKHSKHHALGARGQEKEVHIPTLTIAQKSSQIAPVGMLAQTPEHNAVFNSLVGIYTRAGGRHNHVVKVQEGL